MENKEIFMEIGAIASSESLRKNIKGEFTVRGYEIEIKGKKATGIRIMPFSKRQGEISTSFFEGEREIQFDVRTKVALKFAKEISDIISGRFALIDFSTNLMSV